MPAIDAVQEAFQDLCAHEMAVMAGLRAALVGVLRRFDPKAVEKRLGTESLLDEIMPHSHKAKAWEAFVALHQELTTELEDDFDALFGKEFRRAYEDQVHRLAEAARKQAAVAK
jgi:type VI secretion system FHA domain protein